MFMTTDSPQLNNQQPSDQELVAEYSVDPEEAQAWLTHLGYTARKTWEDLDADPDHTIPVGSHDLRMIAHVALSDKPVLFEELDPDRYAYGGGTWDIQGLRENAKALKAWHKRESAEAAKQASSPEIERKITRQEVVTALAEYIEDGGNSHFGYYATDDNNDDDFVEIKPQPGTTKLLQDWEQQEKIIAETIGTPQAIHEHTFDQLTLWFDAGERDKDEIEYIVDDCLRPLEKVAQDEGLVDLSERIKRKIDEMSEGLISLPEA